MRILSFIIFTLSNYNIYASTIAIAESFQANTLAVYCSENEQWQNNCHDTEKTAVGHYDVLFKRELDTVAFGVNHDTASLLAACKNDFETTWYNCGPSQDFSYLSTAYQNNHDEFLIIGHSEQGELSAACVNAQHEWQDCSPQQDTQNFYSKGAVAYGNKTWMVLAGTREWINGYTIIPALCMHDENKSWYNCDVILEDPNQAQYHSIYAFEALEYLPKENLWIAVGMGGKNLFKSICRYNDALLWEDCTSGELPSSGVQKLVQNKAGDLLQINIVSHFTPDDYLLSSQILCRTSQQEWQDCSGSIKDKMDNIYVSATFDELSQQWLLIGNHSENNQITFLTATQAGDDWQVKRQMNTNSKASYLVDVL